MCFLSLQFLDFMWTNKIMCVFMTWSEIVGGQRQLTKQRGVKQSREIWGIHSKYIVCKCPYVTNTI